MGGAATRVSSSSSCSCSSTSSSSLAGADTYLRQAIGERRLMTVPGWPDCDWDVGDWERAEEAWCRGVSPTPAPPGWTGGALESRSMMARLEKDGDGGRQEESRCLGSSAGREESCRELLQCPWQRAGWSGSPSSGLQVSGLLRWRAGRACAADDDVGSQVGVESLLGLEQLCWTAFDPQASAV